MEVIKNLVVFTCVLGLAPCAAVSAQQKKEEKKAVVVIGEELHRASEAERRRVERGVAGPSPMPPGEYKFSVEELDLVNPRPNELDRAIAELCRRYARSDARTRAKMRASISMDEFYRLWTFAQRAAVFAVRERSAARIRDGMTAVAMLEKERVDWRDIPLPLSMLRYAARRIGADPNKLLRNAAALAEKEVAEFILGSVGRPNGGKNIRPPWGLDEVVTEGGFGFIGRDIEKAKYEPTVDMKRLVIDVARLFDTDKYFPWSVDIASDFPRYQLKTYDPARLDRALRSFRAGARVRALPKKGKEEADPFRETLTVYLSELSEAATARDLAAFVAKNESRDDILLGLAEGRLFCLVVGDRATEGVKSPETSQSLARFSPALTEILRRYARR